MSSAGMTSGSPQGSSTSARRRPQNPPSRASNGGPPSRASSPAPGSSSQRDSASASGIDTVVTRLLVSTKVLLEGLTQWSIGNCTDEKISDMYVKLGNDLNAACAAFAREKISMSDLLNVPTELRTCLEACLSEEEASPAVLDQHMPAIKAIVVRLLQGLKTRQNQYRESLARRRDADVPPVPPVTSPTVVSNPARVASPPPGSTTSREQTHRKKSSLANSTSSVSSEGPHETPQERSSFGNSVSSRTARSATSNTLSDSFASSTRPSSPSQASIPRSKSTGQMPATSPTSHQPSLPTLNFEPAPLPKPSTSAVSVSKDMDSRNIKNPSPQPQSQNSTDKSFETLRNQDNLVRRASKRFSRYTLDKMTGSPAKEDLTAGSASPTPAHRRSFRPPMPVIPPSPGDRNLHTKDLAGSPSSSQANSPREPWDSHVNDLDARPNNAAEAAQRPSGPWNQRVANLEDSQTLSASAGNGRSPFATLTERSETSSTKPLDHNQNETTQEALSKEAPYQQPEPPEFAATQVFLQLGRETKKATIDADQMPPTVASLRVMFMDRFSYNSGQEDFPQIYIRDPKLGVEYELEDMSEIKDGVLLSLNIEPLDQVKQHIDLALSGISLELRDLKSTMSAASRKSMPSTSATAWSPSVAAVASPTLPPHATTAAPSFRNSASLSEVPKTPLSPAFSDHMSTSLRRYQDEVQSVRRDLAGLRQIYSEYTKDHKSVLETLRTQITRMKSLAANKVSGSRAFIDAGKTKLDGRSQDLLSRIEGLMDTVEAMRDDVTVRRVRPAHHKMEDLRNQIQASRTELDEVLTYLSSVKPAWKKTWSEELQNVVEEQRFLKHQEELLDEMSEDHKEMASMFDNIDELMKKMGVPANTSGAKSGPKLGLREYIPPEPDKDHQGLSTVMTEVRSLAVDPEKRLRAIQDAEKARIESKGEREHDKFAKELGGFVESKQLRRTGGAEEAERVRQLKDAETRKQMFTATQQPLPDSPRSTDSSARPYSTASQS